MQGWGPISLAAVTSTGNLTQLYPAWAQYQPYTQANPPAAQAGVSIPTTAGQTYRRPMGGTLGQASVESDGTNGGTIQLYDISGLDVLADVSSALAITNTQLTTALNNGQAKIIWEQVFAASPGAPIIWNWTQGFLRGLAARFVGTTGVGATCKINIIADGGFQYVVSAGVYNFG